MAAVVRQRPLLPELFDWADQFPPFFAARSLMSPHLIRVEDKIEDGHYVIRAEIPGIDPDKDVKITVEDDMLVINAERTEDKSDKTHSEFQYGSFRRAMTLPTGAKADDIKATYNDGILTVAVGVGAEPSAQARQIPVVRG
jgi:HSP20 family molecular chaperone IbpA